MGTVKQTPLSPKELLQLVAKLRSELATARRAEQELALIRDALERAEWPNWKRVALGRRPDLQPVNALIARVMGVPKAVFEGWDSWCQKSAPVTDKLNPEARRYQMQHAVSQIMTATARLRETCISYGTMLLTGKAPSLREEAFVPEDVEDNGSDGDE